MNIRYIILIILSILFWRHGHAQYPTAGTKQRLGYQTTGDGLVFRGSGAPTYTPTGLNNAWTYLDTVSRNIYTYVGGTWQLVSGGGSAFDGHVDSLVFNTNVTVIDSTAKMYWDANSETVSLGVDGGAVYQMGEELFYPLVINKSGATILNGQLVMVDTATLVTGDHVRIILARNGATYPSSYIMGVATTDIPNDSTGLVTWFGYVREVKHADIAQTGVTLVPGNILYASATEPGRYTNVAPTTPAHKSTIALVVRKPSANNMTLLVRPWLAPRLADLSDVNTSSVTGLSVLRYNSTTGIWDASATPGIVAADTAAMLSPYLRKVDTTAMLLPYLRKADTTAMLSPYLRKVDTLSLSNRINLKLNIADTTAMLAPYAKGSSTAGRVAYWSGTRDLTGSANLTWTEANKTLGINTTTTSGANLIIKNTQEPTRATVVATQTFGADTTNWTRGTGWTFNGTQAVATAATGNLTYTPALTITSGNGYEVTFTVASYSAGTATIALGNATYTVPQINQTNNVILLRPTSATGGFRITTSTFTGNLDNITIVEISNPASVLFSGQTTSNSIAEYFTQSNATTRSLNGTGKYNTGTSNLFLGQNAGLNNTSASSNIFIGENAGQNNTTGLANYFIGGGAGQNNTTGTQNVFIGNSAGGANITGSFNVFIGRIAGWENTTGSENLFFGGSAGRRNTTGDKNMFIGNSAGLYNTTGFGNLFLGTNSGAKNRTGYENIAIGISSMDDFVNSDSLTGFRNIAIGRIAANNIYGNASGNIAIGSNAQLPTGNASYQMNIGNLIYGAGIDGGLYGTARGNLGILRMVPTYVLDINSTNAIRFPVGTTAQRPTGATGVVRYNSDSTKLEYHNGTAWSGLQSTITNPVTGTGTAGQVSYWSGTGAQAGSANFTFSDPLLTLNTQSTAGGRGFVLGQYNSGVQAAQLIARKARGTLASPTAAAAGDFVYGNSFEAYNGTQFKGFVAHMAAFVSGTVSADFTPTSIGFTAGNQADNYSPKLLIHHNGNVGVGNNGTIFPYSINTPAYALDVNATGAIRIPVGTTAQQPTGAAGIVRYNSTNTALEFHNGTAWKTVANTDNTVQTFNFSINIYNASDTVKNITSPANFFLVPANLNGYCIDSYQVKALSGTGTADIQLAKNGSGANTQAISGTTAYNKDTNVTLATGDVIQGQVFNLSAGATLVGLGFTIEIKATCN